MTRVSILPVPAEDGVLSYRAVAGEKHSQLRPDSFFTAEQQRRLAELMERWRAARGRGEALTAAEQSELDALVDAELRAAAARAAQIEAASAR